MKSITLVCLAVATFMVVCSVECRPDFDSDSGSDDEGSGENSGVSQALAGAAGEDPAVLTNTSSDDQGTASLAAGSASVGAVAVGSSSDSGKGGESNDGSETGSNDDESETGSNDDGSDSGSENKPGSGYASDALAGAAGEDPAALTNTSSDDKGTASLAIASATNGAAAAGSESGPSSK